MSPAILAIWPMFGEQFGRRVSRTRKNGVRVVRKQVGGTPPRKVNAGKLAKRWEQIVAGRAAHAARQAERHPTGYYGQIAKVSA